MWNSFILFLTSVFVALGFNSPVSKSTTISKDEKDGKSISPDDSIKGPFTKKSIHDRLVSLSKKPAPKELKMGAMCYEMAAPPQRVEYVCPKCGAKTLYASNYVGTIEDISSCRSQVESFKGLNAKLDESEFCKKCRPKIKDPQLCLEINYADDEKVHRTCNVTDTDMQLIAEFLSGSNVHKTFYDAQEPLKDYMERLETLLDIKLEPK